MIIVSGHKSYIVGYIRLLISQTKRLERAREGQRQRQRQRHRQLEHEPEQEQE